MKVDIIIHNHKCPFKQEHEHRQHIKKVLHVTTHMWVPLIFFTRVDSMPKIAGGGMWGW